MTARHRIAMRGILVAGALALTGMGTASADTVKTLTPGKITNVRGVEVNCTGIGEEERARAPQKRLPVKLEMVGGYGQYLAGETIMLANARGETLLQTRCDAPWLLMKLPAGHYTAQISLPGANAQSVAFNAPPKGERSIIVRFPALMAGMPAHDRTQG